MSKVDIKGDINQVYQNVHDTFMSLDKVETVKFPQRLEYGQPVSVTYYFRPESNDWLAKMLAADPEATITAVVTTTLGETYYSNKYKIAKLFVK